MVFLSTLSLRRATTSWRGNHRCACHFYPRSPCGERRTAHHKKHRRLVISIHALLAESDLAFCLVACLQAISIHALLAESDRVMDALYAVWKVFLSTLSLRRATYRICDTLHHKRDFYPRSPCGERPTARRRVQGHHTISIHALLAESDSVAYILSIVRYISIHALLAESDCSSVQFGVSVSLFLSTLSLRRATNCASCMPFFLLFLSTLSLRRATPLPLPQPPAKIFLSTLSLRRATAHAQADANNHGFLSTLSLRRATHLAYRISPAICHFYPRSPCGERRDEGAKATPQSIISIHALLAESDNAGLRHAPDYPISIHALLAESDSSYRIDTHHRSISIHALLAESDPKRLQAQLHGTQFLSTLSLRRATIEHTSTFRCIRISIHALLAESDSARR